MGSDSAISSCVTVVTYFNPRSPCGERQATAVARSVSRIFQSTLPVWGATLSPLGSSAYSSFQSTLPVWGATQRRQVRRGTSHISIHAPRVGSDAPGKPGDKGDPDFNPRSPCGERHGHGRGHHRHGRISIHAPRVGSDLVIVGQTNITVQFQSTLPVWGATGHGRGHHRHGRISIHAPRVGSDFMYWLLTIAN